MMKRFSLPLCFLGASLLLVTSTQGIVMNMRDADIRELIEVVSKTTGKTMIMEPSIKGIKVTVLDQQDKNEEEIYALFLSILSVNGLAAIENNGVVRIVRTNNARSEAVPVAGANNSYSGDELITQVIKVENVSADLLLTTLRPLVAQPGGHMVAVRGSNALVVHDKASNIKRIQRIIEDIDKESNEEIEVIQLEHASASEVVRILETLARNDGQQQALVANAPRYVADERTNSILLSADKRTRLRLRGLISQLDTPLASSGNTKVIYLKYAKAPDLVTVLTGVGESIEQDAAQPQRANRAGGNNNPYSIEADEATNSLVITAPPDLMRSFENVIRQLDIRRNQVHVEAVIVEISDVRAKELGVQWLFAPADDEIPVGVFNFNNTGPSIAQIGGAALANRGQDGTSTTVIAPDGTTTTTSTPNNGDNGAALSQVLSGLTGAAFGFGRFEDSGLNWAAFVKALGSDTDSNILSQPSLTVLDNEEAEFKVGQEIPILTGSTLGDNNSNPFTTVDRKDVGILMKLKPQINEGDSVRLDIEQEISSIAGTTATDVITNKREVKTSVMVGDGGMLVLGGLIDDDIQESSQQVPILGDIPVLGYLFKSQRTQKTKRNLMIFIHPRIIRDDSRAARISSRKYNLMRAQQIQAREAGVNLMPSVDPQVLPEWDEDLILPPSFDEYNRARVEEDGQN